MGDELALTVGCLAKNSGNLLCERSSASVFLLPGMCSAWNVKWWYTSRKNKHLSSCVNSGSWLPWLCNTATTVSLLHHASTCPPLHGISSFTAIYFVGVCWSHFNWNHSFCDQAPHPHELEASEASIVTGVWYLFAYSRFVYSHFAYFAPVLYHFSTKHSILINALTPTVCHTQCAMLCAKTIQHRCKVGKMGVGEPEVGKLVGQYLLVEV